MKTLATVEQLQNVLHTVGGIVCFVLAIMIWYISYKNKLHLDSDDEHFLM